MILLYAHSVSLIQSYLENWLELFHPRQIIGLLFHQDMLLVRTGHNSFDICIAVEKKFNKLKYTYWSLLFQAQHNLPISNRSSRNVSWLHWNQHNFGNTRSYYLQINYHKCLIQVTVHFGCSCTWGITFCLNKLE